MPPELLQDEPYASEDDSDFAPEDAPGEESSVSDDDEAAADVEAPAPGKRKRPDGQDGAEDAGFENSGDEAIIGKGKRQSKKSKRKEGDGDDDEGGEGGLIKTRRMRAVEYVGCGYSCQPLTPY